MNAPLPLAAIDVVEVVRILIVVVVFVIIMIGKLMAAMRVPQRPPARCALLFRLPSNLGRRSNRRHKRPGPNRSRKKSTSSSAAQPRKNKGRQLQPIPPAASRNPWPRLLNGQIPPAASRNPWPRLPTGRTRSRPRWCGKDPWAGRSANTSRNISMKRSSTSGRRNSAAKWPRPIRKSNSI